MRAAAAIAALVVCGACGDLGRAEHAQRASGPAGDLACSEPREGCPCASNQPPLACTPEQPAEPGFCLQGTRRCVQGRLGACEDVRRYPAPALPLSALVDTQAEHAQCSDCEPNCFRVGDAFDPADGPLSTAFAQGVQYHGSGAGLTLQPRMELPPPPPAPMLPDGTLYLPLPQGLTAGASHAARVRPPRSDVYLLLDRSLAMAEPLQWLHDRFASTALLPPGTECGDGDGSLLEQGVSGALRCAIPDSELGLGSFGDIPFEPYASDSALPEAERAADARRELAFRQHAAQSADLSAVGSALAALGGVESTGDPDLASSQIAALYALATGEGLFAGIGRASVPASAGCPGERFGYPCFREGARPVAVVVTSAPMHEGPPSVGDPSAYDPAHLSMLSGTSPGVTRVAGNDAWSSAHAVPGDAGSTLALFEGSTAALAADVDPQLAGCGADALSPDALFRFQVQAEPDATVPVTLSTEGSSFATSLAVFAPSAAGAVELPHAAGNDVLESAYEMGDVARRRVFVEGDTTTPGDALTDMSADYQRSLFGTECGASTLGPDVAFRFDVGSAPGPVELTVRLEMAEDTGAVAVYEAGEQPPRWPARTTELIATGNDDASPAGAFAIPSGTGNEYVTVLGDSSALGADYDASALGGDACAPDSASPDAAFVIVLSETRTLRFDTEGSSFDTVLSLHDAPPVAGPGAPDDGLIACDDNGEAPGMASVLTRTLPAGEYYLIVKGKQAGDAGPYQLTVRDVDAVQAEAVVCGASAGPGEPAVLSFTAQPDRSYYALVKGVSASDLGVYWLELHDTSTARLACDADSGPDGSSLLTLPLAAGDYYAVVKGRGAGERGEYRLAVGGAEPVPGTFAPPGYEPTIAALQDAGVHVATVLACADGEPCEHARAQGEQLASDTGGALRAAESPEQVPAEIVRAVQLVEAFDRVSAELRFEPDPNPGFVLPSVRALPDPNNLCGASDGPASFGDCLPGALPSFRVTLAHSALAPVAPKPDADGYSFTLRITGERDGEVVLQQDVPVLAAPSGGAPAGSYESGSYHQDLEASGCSDLTERPSWDELTVDADVLPDTRVTFYACSAERAEDLAECEDGESSSGYVRVLTISAGQGSGTPCSVETQDEDCPGGYCSPYTGVCNHLEGAQCSDDEQCPGIEPERCRSGPSAAELGTTCAVEDMTASPAYALVGHNHRPFLRVRAELESQGDGSRTPAVFYWEARYRCRSVQ